MTMLPICVLGHHELDYPRNQHLQEALRAGGREVILCHSRTFLPLRHLVLAAKYLRIYRRVKVVLVTEGGHRLVPLVRLLAALTGRKLMFDPFLSRYETRVEDRRLYAPRSLRAAVAWWQDWSSTHAADFLLFDTEEHRQYFFTRYGLHKPSAVVPVSIPGDSFRPDGRPKGARGAGFRVLFYGTYIPLQGVETIVRAAAELAQEPGLQIDLIGEGQTRPEVQALSDRLGRGRLPLSFEDRIPFEELPGRIAAADVVLGIFGSTDKAQRVVPNKVVQAAAMGAAMVTADTPAIRRFFSHGESVYLVPAADGAALAAALRTLRADPALVARLGAGARRVYEREFSLEAVSRRLCDAVMRLEQGDSSGSPTEETP